MQNYKDFKVWTKAHSLTLDVYKETKQFPSEEKFGLTSQLRRASSSIPAKIAEGCGKNTNAEFRHFLNIALGSANEVEYFLLLAKDLHYLPEENFNVLTIDINSIKAMLIALIAKVKATLIPKT
ncbi:MAG: four helix bundle protein [Chitinophagales bacterium]|nr:four helix bundle protein [Chitinophagales bacterium]